MQVWSAALEMSCRVRILGSEDVVALLEGRASEQVSHSHFALVENECCLLWWEAWAIQGVERAQ